MSLKPHSSPYPLKLTKSQVFRAVSLNGTEKFLETVSLLRTSYGKKKEERKLFPLKTLTENRCDLQNL